MFYYQYWHILENIFYQLCTFWRANFEIKPKLAAETALLFYIYVGWPMCHFCPKWTNEPKLVLEIENVALGMGM